MEKIAFLCFTLTIWKAILLPHPRKSHSISTSVSLVSQDKSKTKSLSLQKHEFYLLKNKKWWNFFKPVTILSGSQ